MWPFWSRCGPVRGIISLLGLNWRSQMLKIGLTCHSLLLPVDNNIELPVASAWPYLQACCHASYHGGIDWTFGTTNQTQLNDLLYKRYRGHGVSSHQWNPNLDRAEIHYKYKGIRTQWFTMGLPKQHGALAVLPEMHPSFNIANQNPLQSGSLFLSCSSVFPAWIVLIICLSEFDAKPFPFPTRRINVCLETTRTIYLPNACLVTMIPIYNMCTLLTCTSL